jgi:hypothetical protein
VQRSSSGAAEELHGHRFLSGLSTRDGADRDADGREQEAFGDLLLVFTIAAAVDRAPVANPDSFSLNDDDAFTAQATR